MTETFLFFCFWYLLLPTSEKDCGGGNSLSTAPDLTHLKRGFSTIFLPLHVSRGAIEANSIDESVYLNGKFCSDLAGILETQCLFLNHQPLHSALRSVSPSHIHQTRPSFPVCRDIKTQSSCLLKCRALKQRIRLS